MHLHCPMAGLHDPPGFQVSPFSRTFATVPSVLRIHPSSSARCLGHAVSIKCNCSVAFSITRWVNEHNMPSTVTLEAATSCDVEFELLRQPSIQLAAPQFRAQMKISTAVCRRSEARRARDESGVSRQLQLNGMTTTVSSMAHRASVGMRSRTAAVQAQGRLKRYVTYVQWSLLYCLTTRHSG